MNNILFHLAQASPAGQVMKSLCRLLGICK